VTGSTRPAPGAASSSLMQEGTVDASVFVGTSVDGFIARPKGLVQSEYEVAADA
jgi:hypothetical protein